MVIEAQLWYTNTIFSREGFIVTKIGKENKHDIVPDCIKANIYDQVELLVDFHGITKKDIESAQEKIKKVLNSKEYSMSEEPFSLDELQYYAERHNISILAQKRMKETEHVIRFYSKDSTECITISRLYIGITLSYEVAHNLKTNIILLSKLVRLFAEQEYFEVENVYLIKKNSIYCSSLYRVYQCFDKQAFGDTGYMLKRRFPGEIRPLTSEIYNVFEYNGAEVKLYKSVIPGAIAGSEEEIYEASLLTIVIFDTTNADEEIDIGKTLEKLNEISFKVFIHHITESFAEDLIKGFSDKVKAGVNKNE